MLHLRNSSPSAAEVARHYDELDVLYRHLWGPRLHHGLWEEGGIRNTTEATARLLQAATEPLSIKRDQQVVDIGCGYGEDARWIAEHFGASVHGLSVSSRQTATGSIPPAPRQGELSITTGDWLTNTFDDEAFHAAIAIESLSHMTDKAAFFSQLERTLTAGARASVACWTIASDLGALERVLLGRLCRAGQIPSLGTLTEYRHLASRAGLGVFRHREVTTLVAPTWNVIGRNSLTALFRPHLLLPLLRAVLKQPALSFVVPAMILAYRTRALEYHLLWLEKPRT